MQKEMPRETTFKCPSCDGVMSVDTRDFVRTADGRMRKR